MSKALSSNAVARTLLTSFFAAAILLASSMAYAQNARTLLRKGNKLFAAGDYRAAFGAFEAGYKKNPSPVFLRSMAFCKLKLYEHKEARKLLKTFLEKFKKAADYKKLEETVNNLDDVVQTTVEITSTPPGADIYIDAEATGKVGQTPKTLTIEPGTHTIILRKAGFQVTTKTVAITARKAHPVALALELPLKVTSEPAGADVRIDDEKGTPVGKTPYEGGVVPGKHTVYVSKAGYKTIKHEVDAQAGAPTVLMAKLNLGIRIETKPPGAVVSLDGTKVGSTPVEVEVLPGKHKIEIALEGFRPEVREIDAAVGKVSDVSVALQGGLLTMRSSMEGATVEVGGIAIGKTPLDKASVPMGTKEVVLRHPDRRTWSEPLDFSDTHLVKADVRMGRKSWPLWLGLGLTVAAATVGTVTGIIALGQKDDYVESTDRADMCWESSLPEEERGDGNLQSCPYGKHTASTASFIAAGVAAVATAAYWYFLVRADETVESVPRTSAGTTGTKRASLPANLPRTAPSLSQM